MKLFLHEWHDQTLLIMADQHYHTVQNVHAQLYTRMESMATRSGPLRRVQQSERLRSLAKICVADIGNFGELVELASALQNKIIKKKHYINIPVNKLRY